MEKLLELLNEYDSYWDYDEDYGPYMPGMDRDAYWYHKYYIISKKFGFIKWLVENDKIDFYEGKYLENPIGSNNYDECDYLELIQWLAISDTPIEDLIYYLK